MRRITLGAHAIGAGLLVMLAAGAPSAHADEMLTYTGNYFTNFVGSDYGPTDQIIATFTLSTPLPDNCSSDCLISSDVTAFSMNDGLQIFNQSNSGYFALLVDTNNSGQITNWYFVAEDTGTGQEITSSTTEDFVYFGFREEAYNTNPGVWQYNNNDVPEPGTLALFGVALLALGGLGLRRTCA